MIMEKMTKIGVIIIFCFTQLFIQCTSADNKDAYKKETEQYGEEIITLRNFLAESLSMDIKKITYDLNENAFIIDGDVVMPLDQARGNYDSYSLKNTNKTDQRFSGYIMKFEIASAIQIFISPEVTSDWQIAINKAIDVWNNTNSGINITAVTASTSSNVKIIMGNIDSKATIANAYYPYGGQPGERIMINTSYINKLNDAQRINVIIHELGHIFGLAHTNDPFNSLIPCTPVSEMTSIMFSIVSDSTAFTTYDNIAISTLYPVNEGTKKLYRFKKGQYYFYTVDPCEIIDGQNGYVYDGDLGYLYSTQVLGTVLLYRSINGSAEKGHKLSKSQTFSNDIILGYLYLDQYSGSTALYCYKNSTQDFYTVENLGPLSRLTYGFVPHKIVANGKYDGITF